MDLITLKKNNKNSECVLYGGFNGEEKTMTINYNIFLGDDLLKSLDFFCFDINNGYGYYDSVRVVYIDDEEVKISITKRFFNKGNFY